MNIHNSNWLLDHLLDSRNEKNIVHPIKSMKKLSSAKVEPKCDQEPYEANFI
jgi:hypothetical protein